MKTKSFFILLALLTISFTSASVAQPYTCDGNTLALYHFDETSGTTVTNACASGSGVAVGTTIVAGKYGNARSFNGNSDYIQISNLSSPATRITIEAWVYVKSYPVTGGETKYIYKRRGHIADHSLGIWHDGKLIFTLCDGGSGCPGVLSSIPVPKNTWTHVAGTYDGGTMKVYINGAQVGSYSISFTLAWSPLLGTAVGRDPDAQTERYFDGLIDELRISDIARTFSGGIGAYACDAKTLALYHFDETGGTSVYDACNSSYTGVAVGTTILNGQYSRARSFNGTSDYIQISNLSSSTTEMAIEAWVYVKNYPITGGETKYIYKRRGHFADHSLGIWYDGKLIFTLCDGGSGCPGVLSTIPVPKNTWTHVAGTYDGTKMSVWVNGERVGSYAISFNLAWSPVIGTAVGRDPDGQSERYFDGYIDELRISSMPRVGTTNVEEPAGAIPTTVTLSQNYPNPFNPSTIFEYAITERSNVRVQIFNRIGQLVATLFDGPNEAGSYRMFWNAKTTEGQTVSSGPYFYQLTVNGTVQAKRMLFIK